MNLRGNHFHPPRDRDLWKFQNCVVNKNWLFFFFQPVCLILLKDNLWIFHFLSCWIWDVVFFALSPVFYTVDSIVTFEPKSSGNLLRVKGSFRKDNVWHLCCWFLVHLVAFVTASWHLVDEPKFHRNSSVADRLNKPWVSLFKD